MTMVRQLDGADVSEARRTMVAAAAQLACLLEASAPKPGNVSPGRHFADMRYEDFLASAVALGDPLSRAAEQSLGPTIHACIRSTADWTAANTNLGIALMFAPLARAALMLDDGVASAPRTPTDVTLPEHLGGLKARLRDLRAGVADVLSETSVADAREVYAAIRLASPGGLGSAPDQDVAGEPTLTLLEVMRLAAERDAIAREYATSFETTFDRAIPALIDARRDRLSWDDAVVETFLTLLARAADTHVVRRGGAAAAEAITQRAAAALAAGGVRTIAGRRLVEEMDAALRDEHNVSNPGSTADLTAAAIFAFLLAGGWERPAGRSAARAHGQESRAPGAGRK